VERKLFFAQVDNAISKADLYAALNLWESTTVIVLMACSGEKTMDYTVSGLNCLSSLIFHYPTARWNGYQQKQTCHVMHWPQPCVHDVAM